MNIDIMKAAAARGYNKTTLAAKIGISRQALDKRLRSDMKTSSFLQFAEVLNCSLHELIIDNNCQYLKDDQNKLKCIIL